MSVLSAITAMLMAIATTDAGFATPAFLSTPQSAAQSIQSSSSTSSCLMAYRERTNYDQKGARSTVKNSRKRRDDSDLDNDNDYNGSGRGYDDFEDDFDQPYTSQKKSPQPSASQSQSNNKSNNSNSAETTAPAQASTFYSQKSLTDPSFSSETQFFQQLCNSANIHRPSRIQSLAWPPLLRGENCIVADQTGSGKTLAYLLPLLQKLHASDKQDEVNGMKATEKKKKRTGAPRVVILTPTAELADQIFKVCSSLGKNLAQSSGSEWTFNPFVTTATGSHSTNIRDQIRLLQSTPVDVLVSTPGRLSTILRTKNVGLDLGHVQSLVLDEVDFLLVDETFGPQLRTVGVAVQGGENAKDGSGAQFIFVTATLPEDVLASIQTEFENVTQLRGPGLHRITPTVAQTLVDVSVPPTSNKDKNACFDIKMREMFKALRGKRVNKTLIFCNTVETCRSVENVLRRKDRKGRRNRVWAYHNALSPEVRLKNLNSFSSSVGDDDITESILVCTDRAARGIDFDASPIDHVVLFDFPKDPAEYVRRVGRTARAGRAGASTVLAYGWQLPVARQIMGLSGGTKKGKGKRGDAKLAAFNMMKSGDGWDDDEKEDEYYVKGGARKRREVVAGGVDTKKKKPKRKKGDKAKPWKEVNQ